MNRGAIAEISLSAIANNLLSVKSIVKNSSIIAVVKADAYGHGAVEVSKRLLQGGASFLAVAYTGEALELRNYGIDAPIIVLFDCEEIRDYFHFNLIPVVSSLNTALSFSWEAEKRKTRIKIHVKIDTGMGRLGLSSNRIIDDLITISEMPGLEIQGLLSHFSEADLLDRSYAIEQFKKFNAIRKTISDKLRKKIFSHIANSAAVLTFEDSYLDAVRPGLMLYGYSPLNKKAKGGEQRAEKKSDNVTLIPAMTVKTRILCIRNVPSGTPISYGRTFVTKRASKIGVIPVGYADGYSRLFSNNAEVLVKGKRVPVVGRVCMDLTMTDLTDIADVTERDEAVILGTQGDESINAYELAEKAHTIPYEILTSLGSRSRKTYVETH